MDPVAEIERARASELVDADGKRVRLELAPPAPPAVIDALERETGFALPAELRRLLEYTAGLDGVLDLVEFTGNDGFELVEVFPAGLPIAGDGFGNFWVVDLTPADVDAAPVFFACHDPPIILLQSASIGAFLHELFRGYAPPHASLVDDVSEDRLFNVWGTNPGVVAQPQALASEDAVLARFAATLDPGFEIVDLRAAPVGMGFSWGRYGPRTLLQRDGYARLFAYARPPRRPGLAQRLRSRFSGS